MLPIAVRPPAFVQLPEDVADSVDRPLLWVKLRRVGMEVTVFELYRHIYSNLSYIVRVAGEFPDASRLTSACSIETPHRLSCGTYSSRTSFYLIL